MKKKYRLSLVLESLVPDDMIWRENIRAIKEPFEEYGASAATLATALARAVQTIEARTTERSTTGDDGDVNLAVWETICAHDTNPGGQHIRPFEATIHGDEAVVFKADLRKLLRYVRGLERKIEK